MADTIEMMWHFDLKDIGARDAVQGPLAGAGGEPHFVTLDRLLTRLHGRKEELSRVLGYGNNTLAAA